MSASNDALPTPASTSSLQVKSRRRTVSTSKADANGDILTEVNDTLNVNGKDLADRNAVRGESVVERPRDGSEPATPVVVYRRKKLVSRSETPKWQTVLSIMMKLCLLVLGLVWLGQMILNLSNGNGGGAASYSFAALESDGRISELESFVKKTTKMFQVQLEVVDKKIETEIGTVSREMRKKIEKSDEVLEKELKRLQERTDNVGKSLLQLKEMGLLTKNEFESFKDELKKRQGLYGSGVDVSLDEIGALAKDIVQREIEKHAADGIGRVDYALASGGARVITHSEPFTSGKATNWFSVGKDHYRVHSNAKKMLEPSFGEPGQCFALQGSSGYVEIRLRAGVIPQAITLEHVSKSVAYDRSSAPKDCIVSGWFEGSGEPPQVLTKFSYDLDKSNAQTFNVEKNPDASVVGVVNMVRLDFSSNHGNPQLTCIYRFRVHGYEKDSNLEDTQNAVGFR